MIPTGRVVNFKLGDGNTELFDLLGGSFGTGGEIVRNGGGFGVRFFPNGKDTILRAAASGGGGGSWSSGGGTGGTWGGGGGGPAQPRPRER